MIFARIFAVWGSASFSGAAKKLQQAANDPLLSPSAKSRAAELADRLSYGVRVVVVGPKGAGKSTLCDAILGTSHVTPRLHATRVFASEPLQEAKVAVLGEIEMHPLADCGLGHAQLIDVALPGGGPEGDARLAECLALADIALWCTQRFDATEAKLWREMPDALKDHSFLVLTKADDLAEAGLLEDRVTALRAVVSEEFHSFFPVTTSHLRHLQQRGVAVPEGQLAASGLKALIEAVAGIVRSGQRADLDSGLLFLERHGLTLDAAVDSVAEVTPDERVSTPVNLPLVHQPSLSPQPFRVARDKIMERAFDLAELGFDEADGDMTEVLELCGTISEDLAEEMRRQAEVYPEVVQWCETVEEANDKITLMTMENDTRSAADAVTILLQLRRDFEQLSFQ